MSMFILLYAEKKTARTFLFSSQPKKDLKLDTNITKERAHGECFTFKEEKIEMKWKRLYHRIVLMCIIVLFDIYF